MLTRPAPLGTNARADAVRTSARAAFGKPVEPTSAVLTVSSGPEQTLSDEG